MIGYYSIDVDSCYVVQGGAPKIAKLLYNSNFTRTYGRYIELVNGIINQQT